MKKRDYLRSQGFRVGERGRFTDAMKTCLALYDGVFEEDMKPLKMDNLSDYPKKKKKENKHNQRTPLPPDSPKVREYRVLTGFTEFGAPVGFDGCQNCGLIMTRCQCPKGIYAPKIVTSSADPLVYVP